MFYNTFQPDFILVGMCKFANDMGATKKMLADDRYYNLQDDKIDDYYHYQLSQQK